jgi:sugar O-acyltransferase (sialic acid O-acetyltransferase NeuD family)
VDNIVLIGASGHAHLLIEVIEKEGRVAIAGMLDRDLPVGTDCMGYQVLGCERDLPAVMRTHDVGAAMVAIGDNWVRRRVVERLREIVPGLRFERAVHPSAQIARGAEIGEGAVVMASAVLNANARLGRHCFVSTKASLSHDSVMGDFSSLGPNATTGGAVRIGAGTAIALSADVIHGITIGEHTVIGAGSVVLKNMPDRVVAYGIPARVIRSRAPGDKYL